MKRLLSVAVITGLLLTTASISWASANLNLSKSNINKVASDGMDPGQTAALVAKLDNMPRVDEAAVRQALRELSIPANFRLIRVTPGRPNTIILLMDPANANAAEIAVSDPGMPPEKPVTRTPITPSKGYR